MSDSCARCSKKVYATEKVVGTDLMLHKLCFRCTTCTAPLSLKNYVASGNAVYCKTHTPVITATVISDPLAVVAAVNAPKRASEGLKKTALANGEAIGITLGALQMNNDMQAPKPQLSPSGAVQKGDETLLALQKPAEIVNPSNESILKSAALDQ